MFWFVVGWLDAKNNSYQIILCENWEQPNHIFLFAFDIVKLSDIYIGFWFWCFFNLLQWKKFLERFTQYGIVMRLWGMCKCCLCV